jgi:hypothetical protein
VTEKGVKSGEKWRTEKKIGISPFPHLGCDVRAKKLQAMRPNCNKMEAFKDPS